MLALMYARLKRAVYNVVWITDEDHPINDIYDKFIISLIVLNLIAIVLETMQGIYKTHKVFFEYFDMISIIVFSIDYVFRLWCCNLDQKFKGILKGRIRFVLTPMAIIDLLSIMPTFLFATTDLRILRVFRLFRIFRILKLTKYCKGFIIIRNALQHKKDLLISSFVLIFIVLFCLSSIVYYCENGAQPDKFCSIPHTLWWGVITLTSVGYGDIFPVTTLGKFFTCIIALLAIPLTAIPGGVIFSGLIEEINKEEKRN